MSSLATAYTAGFEAALEKFAATRAMREIVKSVAAGTPQGMARANMIAKAPGVITSPMGSGIKDLGGGAEGLATLVAHPQHGVAVRKMFSPAGGGYSPELIARKEQLGSLPGAAQYYGSTRSMHNTPVHFNEYVQGSPVVRGQMTEAQRNATQDAMLNTSRALRKAGYRGMDIRDANMMMTPSGKAKVIDYLPFRPDETQGARASQNLRHNADRGLIPRKFRDMMPLSEKGMSMVGQTPSHGFDPTMVPSHDNPALRKAMQGRFNKYMFTGEAAPMPVAPPARASGTAVVPSAGQVPQASAGGSWSQLLGGSSANLPASAPTSMLTPQQSPTQISPGPAPMSAPRPAPSAPAAPPRATGLSEFL